MSGIDWNGILRLPEAALAGCRRIPKTVLVKQAMLTKTEQKRLDKVARLEHFATVQKSTTRIPPYEDDERNVQSVVFLRCEMTAGTMAVAEVAELVHKCFPNPTVLLVEAGGCACISVALTSRYDEMGASVKRLKEQRRSKDITLNESAKLRMEMKEEERRLRAVADEIKEICNGRSR